MKRLNPVFIAFFTLLIGATLFLSSCGGPGVGYGRNAGNYGPAQESPNVLSQEHAGPAEPGAGPATPQAAPNQQNLRHVKVAILLPLTGEYQQLGQSMLKAAQMALFDAGYDGFELVPRDTGTTPDQARAAAQAAISGGAELILGPIFSESVQAVKPVAAQANINVIAFSTDWKQAGGNAFIMGFLPFDQVNRVLQYAASRNIRRVGVLAPDSDYGRIATTVYEDSANRLGLQTTGLSQFNAQNLDLSVRQLTKFDERHPVGQPMLDPSQTPFDAVFMPVGGANAKTIGNLLTQFDLNPARVRRIGTGLFDDLSLSQEAGLEGAWFAAPSPRAREEFDKRFLQSYGYTAPRLTTLAYDATALAAVLAKRGLTSTGAPAFDKNSLMNPNGFAGIDGIFRFRPDGTAERGLAVLEIRRGSVAVIDDAPKSFRQTAP